MRAVPGRERERAESARSRGLCGRGLTPSLVWVLSANVPARRFYERMRGREIATGVAQVGDQVLDKTAYAWIDYLPWPSWG